MTGGIRTMRQAIRSMGAVAFTLLAAVMAGCASPIAPMDTDGPPEQLRFTIAGYGVGGRTWELRGDTLQFQRQSWDAADPVETVSLVPTTLEWQAFWDDVRASGVRHWRGNRVATEIADGVGWSLLLSDGRTSVVAMGSNMFPDLRGRWHVHWSPEFEAFVAALERMTARSTPGG